jgi:glucose-6-phosphate isomerase
MKPFNHHLNFKTGEILENSKVIVRHLSDMKGMYYDVEATQKIIKEGDPVIYRFYNIAIPEEYGHLQHCTSIIYPGRVGEEYYMTKGHFHAQENTAEIYLDLQGTGKLLMQKKDTEVEILDMQSGSISYIPPYWAHRVINTGDTPLIFFAVYPGEAGHNYGIIEKKGFGKLIVERNGQIKVIENPNY